VRPREAPTLAAETWLSRAQHNEGSWWPAWTQWLDAHSGSPQSPPRMGLPGRREKSLPPAPGHYVMQK
jgi:polyhydroxyalkanoate synthase